MVRAALAISIVSFLTLCTSLAGCGRSTTPPKPPPVKEVEQQSEPAPPEGSHELQGMTVTVVDPEGGWTFELSAESGKGESLHGPWELQGARGTYEGEGHPPIHMSAARAYLDEEAQRVSLDGNVVIESQRLKLVADHVDYDLATGEVVATGRTK